MKNLNKNIFLKLTLIGIIFITPAYAEEKKEVLPTDELIKAQEKLNTARGFYSVTKAQESALDKMRKASRLSLKAAKLREKAEKLQAKADSFVEQSKQTAVSHGLKFENTMPVKMEESIESIEQSAQAPRESIVPGQPINIILPTNRETAYGAPVPGK